MKSFSSYILENRTPSGGSETISSANVINIIKSAIDYMKLSDEQSELVLDLVKPFNTKAKINVTFVDGEDLLTVARGDYENAEDIENTLKSNLKGATTAVFFQPKDDRYDTFKEGIKPKRIIIINTKDKKFVDVSRLGTATELKYEDGNISNINDTVVPFDVCYFVKKRNEINSTGLERSNWFVVGK